MSHDEAGQCRCVIGHRPAPAELHVHHIRPLARGGTRSPDNEVWLCPTAHANVHELLREYERHRGQPPRLRGYSRYTRALAAEGWRRYGADWSQGGAT
jgi:hypothetical protein